MFSSLFRSQNQNHSKAEPKRYIGNKGEQQALEFLVGEGLELICQNFYSRFGEIDLIMLEQTDNYLVFIEVRHRKNMGYGTARESINQAKQQKLRKTAEYFLLKNKKYRHQPARFDVILSTPTGGKDSIEWLKNAF